MTPRILGVIPARGGSKGVPRKNVRNVGGKPLIAWSIEAARGASALSRCVVSTDDDEIASVAREYGAEVLPRPADFAGDRTPMIEVIRHALDALDRDTGTAFTHVMIIQPTAPMRTASDIDLAARKAMDVNADSVVSVYRVDDAHPSRMYHLRDDVLESFYDEPTGSLRQDLRDVYHRNGAIYLCTRQFMEEQGKLFGGRMVPYVMPKSRSANIDDMTDLKIADFLLSSREPGDE